MTKFSFFLFLISTNILVAFGQNENRLNLFDLIQDGKTFEIEYLLKNRSFSSDSERMLDSVMKTNGLLKEFQERQKNDTFQLYSYKVEIIPQKDSCLKIRIFDYELKTQMSNLDTLNSLYSNYFQQIDYSLFVDKKWKINNINNLGHIIRINKNYLSKANEIRENSYRYSFQRSQYYKTVDIPCSKDEVESYLKLHIIMFMQYSQGLSSSIKFPQKIYIPNFKKPIVDTLFVVLNDNCDSDFTIEKYVNLTKSKTTKFIQSGINNSKNRDFNLSPFDYYNSSKFIIDKKTKMIKVFSISNLVTGKDFKVESDVIFTIKNGS